MLELFRAVFAPPRDLVLLVAAGWLGLVLADTRAKQTAIGEKAIDTLVGVMVMAFLIGGRFLYAASHSPAFISSPASLVSLNAGLFDVWGGLAIAAIAASVVIQRRQLPAWGTLDLLAPFFASFGIGLALAHLASGAAFGKETNVPWAINQWGAQRHPTQFYELVAGTAILGIVWLPGLRATVPGRTFLVWAALAAGSRILIEGFRGDSTLVFGGLRLAQIVAWVVLAAALIGLEMLGRTDVQGARSADKGESANKTSSPPARTHKRQRAAPGKNSAP